MCADEREGEKVEGRTKSPAHEGGDRRSGTTPSPDWLENKITGFEFGGRPRKLLAVLSSFGRKE